MNPQSEKQKAIEALERAETLLVATKVFLEENPVKDYTVIYDEAECDGYCLADDCGTALTDIAEAIRELKKG